MRVSVVSLAGEEVVSIAVQPTAGIVEVREALRRAIGWRRAYAKILHGDEELSAGLSLEDIGATEGSRLILVSLPPLRIAVQRRDGILELRDADTGARIHRLRMCGGTFSAFSRDGQSIVSTRGRVAEIWSVATGERLVTLLGHQDEVASAAFSPDGLQCATASSDKTARTWTTATGECVLTLEGHRNWVASAAFSPDGLLCLTGSWDTFARLWSAATGESTHVLRGHARPVLAATFSPDSLRCVTASCDDTARLWSIAEGECLHVLHGHVSVVRSAAFSPDGLQILTGSQDRTGRLWNVATGKCTCVLRGHEGSIKIATWSDDGLHHLTVSILGGTATLWDADTGGLEVTLRTVNCVAAFVPETLDIGTAAPNQVDSEAEKQQRERDIESDVDALAL